MPGHLLTIFHYRRLLPWGFAALALVLTGCENGTGVAAPSPTAISANSGAVMRVTVTPVSRPTPSTAPGAVVSTPTTGPENAPAPSLALREQVFSDAWEKIRATYVYTNLNGVDWDAVRTKLEPQVRTATTASAFYAVMTDLVQQLHDNGATTFEPPSAPAPVSDLGQPYIGVGILFVEDGGQIVVMEVWPDSPAAQAGIRRRDVLAAVDGERPANFDDWFLRVRGTEGSPVRLTVRSPGQAPRDVTMTRRVITGDPAVEARRLSAAPGIGYIWVPGLFTESTRTSIENGLTSLLKGSPLQGLILDLRYTGRGPADALSPLIRDFMTGDGGRLVSRMGSEPMGGEPRRLYAQLKDVPVIMLVSGDTGGIPEMWAAASQAAGRARLVGQPTPGYTGLIQPYDLADGSHLEVLAQVYEPPSGAVVEGRGLTPDVRVTGDWQVASEDADPGIRRAIELLQAGKK
jgi:carboxyl-terminal processing protease